MVEVEQEALSYVIQTMKGVNGLAGTSETKIRKEINLAQFAMLATDRGRMRMTCLL